MCPNARSRCKPRIATRQTFLLHDEASRVPRPAILALRRIRTGVWGNDFGADSIRLIQKGLAERLKSRTRQGAALAHTAAYFPMTDLQFGSISVGEVSAQDALLT